MTEVSWQALGMFVLAVLLATLIGMLTRDSR